MLTDHRSLAIYGQLRGRRAAFETLESSLKGVRHPRFTVEQVLACDDTVLAARITYGGIGSHGAEYSISMGSVTVVRDGTEVSNDIYDPGDSQAMIARYVELGGGLSALGDTPLERLYAQLARRAARRDIAAMLECVADGCTLTDHRAIGRDPRRGPDGFRAEWEAAFGASPDIRMEVDEVLAVADRTIALLLHWTGQTAQDAGGGQFSVEVGQVATLSDGRIGSIEQFDRADREAMLARFAQLSGAPAALPGRATGAADAKDRSTPLGVDGQARG